MPAFHLVLNNFEFRSQMFETEILNRNQKSVGIRNLDTPLAGTTSDLRIIDQWATHGHDPAVGATFSAIAEQVCHFFADFSDLRPCFLVLAFLVVAAFYRKTLCACIAARTCIS